MLEKKLLFCKTLNNLEQLGGLQAQRSPKVAAESTRAA
jgi:hypothetical protein